MINRRSSREMCGDAIALLDGDIFALSEAMLIALEDDLVTILLSPEGEQPACAMLQLAALLIINPKSAEASVLALLQPVRDRDVRTASTARQFAAMVSAPLRDHRIAPAPASPVQSSLVPPNSQILHAPAHPIYPNLGPLFAAALICSRREVQADWGGAAPPPSEYDDVAERRPLGHALDRLVDLLQREAAGDQLVELQRPCR